MSHETRSRAWTLGAFAASLLVVRPAQAAEGLIVGESPRCRVMLTQISYDDPGADDAEFLELHVDAPTLAAPTPPPVPALPSCGPQPTDAGAPPQTDAADGALTLGACGLGAIELVNGGGGVCEVYRSLPLADVPVPPDGYVVFCATDAVLGSCDVRAAGHSALRNGWLQNGPTDGLRFVGVSGEVTAEVSYEGTPACFSASTVTLLPETGVVPGGSPDADDVNVICDGRFTVFSPAQSPLRAPLPCPTEVTSDAGRSGEGGPAPSGAGGAASPPERAPQTSSYHHLAAEDGGLAVLGAKGTALPRPPSCSAARPTGTFGTAVDALAGVTVLWVAAGIRRRKRRP